MTKHVIQVRPIRSEADYDAALSRVDELIHAKYGTAEGDELDILATLIAAYEDKHHAIKAPNPVAAIEFYMDQKGLTRKDLEAMIGSRARVSEVLSGKRALTLAMIRRLQAGMGISADVLIGEDSHRRKAA